MGALPVTLLAALALALLGSPRGLAAETAAQSSAVEAGSRSLERCGSRPPRAIPLRWCR